MRLKANGVTEVVEKEKKKKKKKENHRIEMLRFVIDILRNRDRCIIDIK